MLQYLLVHYCLGLVAIDCHASIQSFSANAQKKSECPPLLKWRFQLSQYIILFKCWFKTNPFNKVKFNSVRKQSKYYFNFKCLLLNEEFQSVQVTFQYYTVDPFQSQKIKVLRFLSKFLPHNNRFSQVLKPLKFLRYLFSFWSYGEKICLHIFLNSTHI